MLSLPPAFNLSHDQTLQFKSLHRKASFRRGGLVAHLMLGSNTLAYQLNLDELMSYLHLMIPAARNRSCKHPHALPDRLLKNVRSLSERAAQFTLSSLEVNSRSTFFGPADLRDARQVSEARILTAFSGESTHIRQISSL